MPPDIPKTSGSTSSQVSEDTRTEQNRNNKRHHTLVRSDDRGSSVIRDHSTNTSSYSAKRTMPEGEAEREKSSQKKKSKNYEEPSESAVTTSSQETTPSEQVELSARAEVIKQENDLSQLPISASSDRNNRLTTRHQTPFPVRIPEENQIGEFSQGLYEPLHNDLGDESNSIVREQRVLTERSERSTQPEHAATNVERNSSENVSRWFMTNERSHSERNYEIDPQEAVDHNSFMMRAAEAARQTSSEDTSSRQVARRLPCWERNYEINPREAVDHNSFMMRAAEAARQKSSEDTSSRHVARIPPCWERSEASTQREPAAAVVDENFFFNESFLDKESVFKRRIRMLSSSERMEDSRAESDLSLAKKELAKIGREQDKVLVSWTECFDFKSLIGPPHLHVTHKEIFDFQNYVRNVAFYDAMPSMGPIETNDDVTCCLGPPKKEKITMLYMVIEKPSIRRVILQAAKVETFMPDHPELRFLCITKNSVNTACPDVRPCLSKYQIGDLVWVHAVCLANNHMKLYNSYSDLMTQKLFTSKEHDADSRAVFNVKRFTLIHREVRKNVLAMMLSDDALSNGYRVATSVTPLAALMEQYAWISDDQPFPTKWQFFKCDVAIPNLPELSFCYESLDKQEKDVPGEMLKKIEPLPLQIIPHIVKASPLIDKDQRDIADRAHAFLMIINDHGRGVDIIRKTAAVSQVALHHFKYSSLELRSLPITNITLNESEDKSGCELIADFYLDRKTIDESSITKTFVLDNDLLIQCPSQRFNEMKMTTLFSTLTSNDVLCITAFNRCSDLEKLKAMKEYVTEGKNVFVRQISTQIESLQRGATFISDGCLSVAENSRIGQAILNYYHPQPLSRNEDNQPNDLPYPLLLKGNGKYPLDDDQVAAILNIINFHGPVYQVKGAAGTGKTSTIPALCAYLSGNQQYQGSELPLIVVCAATDKQVKLNVTKWMTLEAALSVYAVRLTPKINYEGNWTRTPIDLPEMMENARFKLLDETELSDYNQAINMCLYAPNNPSKVEQWQLRCAQQLRSKFIQQKRLTFLKTYPPRIVFLTIDQLLEHNEIFSTRMRYLIIDEASQLNEVDFLRLLCVGNDMTQTILFGDEMKLSPTLPSACHGSPIEKFLTKRVTDTLKRNDSVPCSILRSVHRTPVMSTKMTSRVFYKDTLHCLRKRNEFNCFTNLLRKHNKIDMVSIKIRSEQEQMGNSLINVEEATFALSIARMLTRKGFAKDDVLFLTLHSYQRNNVLNEIANDIHSVKYPVMMVDSDITEEADVVVLLTTFSPPNDEDVGSRIFNDCGDKQETTEKFVTNKRRIYTATTRHRFGLIIVGSKTLFDLDYWRDIHRKASLSPEKFFSDN